MTQDLGRGLGLAAQPGDFFALVGELGSGKTTLARGILEGLGVPEGGRSPSFPIIMEYRGRFPVHHLDVYRLRRPEELEELGYEEIFYGPGVVIVEWADLIEAYLPAEHLRVELELPPPGEASPGPEAGRRRITFHPVGERYRHLLPALELPPGLAWREGPGP